MPNVKDQAITKTALIGIIEILFVIRGIYNG
jgi:hypothetical protein